MENMTSIYIRASKPLAFLVPISWLIRLITWFKASHVFICLPLMNKVFQVYFNEIEYIGPEYLSTVDTVYQFQVDMPGENYKKLTAYLDSQKSTRKGYYTQLFGIAFTFPFRWFGVAVGNPFSRFFTSMTCSELIARSFLEADLISKTDSCFPKWKLNTLTEKDVVKLLTHLTKNPCGVMEVRQIK